MKCFCFKCEPDDLDSKLDFREEECTNLHVCVQVCMCVDWNVSQVFDK